VVILSAIDRLTLYQSYHIANIAGTHAAVSQRLGLPISIDPSGTQRSVALGDLQIDVSILASIASYRLLFRFDPAIVGFNQGN
jgi:hypothetical protein